MNDRLYICKETHTHTHYKHTKENQRWLVGVSHLSVLPEQGEVGGGVQEGHQRRWLRGKVGEGRDQGLKKPKDVRGI